MIFLKQETNKKENYKKALGDMEWAGSKQTPPI